MEFVTYVPMGAWSQWLAAAALIAIALYVLWAKRRLTAATNLVLIDTLRLAPRHAVHIVEAEGQRFLLATSPTGIETIATLPTVTQADGHATAGRRDGLMPHDAQQTAPISKPIASTVNAVAQAAGGTARIHEVVQ